MSDIRLVHGECGAVMAGLDAESIDLVVTSPPYDNLRTYNGFTFDFEAIAAQLCRVLKPGGVIVWVVADQTKDGSESGTSFRQALHFMSLGLNLHDTMIYQTNKPPMNDNRYQACFEYMFVLSKGRVKTFNPIMVKTTYTHTGKASYRNRDGSMKAAWGDGIIKPTKIKTSIWYFGNGHGQGTLDASASTHPATFPEALARDHILSWSNPGDWILDPFIGSGTTAKQCVLLERNCIGIDISSEYIALSERRVTAAQSQLRMPFEEAPHAE